MQRLPEYLWRLRTRRSTDTRTSPATVAQRHFSRPSQSTSPFWQTQTESRVRPRRTEARPGPFTTPGTLHRSEALFECGLVTRGVTSVTRNVSDGAPAAPGEPGPGAGFIRLRPTPLPPHSL